MGEVSVTRSVYVSITGLRLKRFWHVARFYRHAIPSFRAARQTPGNLRAEVKSVGGVRHTLTVWENKAAMRAFLVTKPHLAAMRAFPDIASGKTYGFETENVPDWDEALRLWHAHGRSYGGDAAPCRAADQPARPAITPFTNA